MDKMNHEDKMARYNINKKAALATIMLAIFIDVLGYSMILPLLPTIAQGVFGASNFTIGLLIASNALSAFICAPIWGRLSDKLGRRPLLVIAQFGTLASFLLLGFSDSLAMIFFSRIMDGVFGGQIPIIRAYIVDITDQKTRSSEMARITGAMAFGMVFGPSIGGLTGVLNWRYPAFIAASLSCISILLALKFIQESMPEDRRTDIQVRKSQRLQNNERDRSVLTNKNVLFRLFQIFCIILAFIMINSSFPLVLTLRYGLDPAMIGLFASLAGVLMIISGISIRIIVKKKGEKKLILFVLILAVIMFLGYPFLSTVWLLLIFVFPYAFSHIAIRSILLTNVSKAVDEDRQGEASGWASNVQSIAQIIAPLIAYSYLEIFAFSFLGISLDAYFMIGLTGAFVSLLLLFLVLVDIRKNPDDFESADEISETTPKITF